MRSGDYENLINVFDANFGHFVTLYRWKDWLKVMVSYIL
jgi:hypothetical protein